MIVLLLIALIILLETIAQTYLKKLNGNIDIFSYELFIAVLIYGIICILLLKSYQYEKVNNVYMLWNGVGIIFLTLFSIIFFDQKIELHEYIASILVFIAMLILYKYNKSE